MSEGYLPFASSSKEWLTWDKMNVSVVKVFLSKTGTAR